MRFCPFCAHDNDDGALACAQCGKRLPPARRAPEAPSGGEVAAPPGTPPPPPGRGPRPGLAPKNPLRARIDALTAAKEEAQPSAPALPGMTKSNPPRTLAGVQPNATLAGVSATQKTLAGVSPEMLGAIAPQPQEPGAAGNGTEAKPLPSKPAVAPLLKGPATVPATPRRSALPLPPPPNDFAAGIETPSAVREITASTPIVVTAEDEIEAHSIGEAEGSERRARKGSALAAQGRQALGGAMGAATRALDWRAVQYLLRAIRDTVRKRGEIGRLRKYIVSEQEKFDGILTALGRQARAEDLTLPALAEEMAATKQLEQARAAAEQRLAELEAQRAQEQERFGALDADLRTRLDTANVAVQNAAKEHEAASNERATYQAGLNRIDTQLKSCSRQISNHEASLLRTADGAEQVKLRGEIQALRAQLSALEPERERFEAKAAELEGPLNDLEAKLGVARQKAAALENERAEAQRIHKDALETINAELKAETDRHANHSRELSLKFATLGTILNLNRVPGPAFDPLYGQFDEVKGRVTDAEAQIAALEAEMQSYDRATVQKGVFVLVASVAALMLLITLAVVVF